MITEKKSWLFNFASSYSGGGLRRLIETARFFEKNGGATFIINKKAEKLVREFSGNNVFFPVVPNKIFRLLKDGYYLENIVREAGKPDIYFSYGLPIFFDVTTVNWFHVSNALSLNTQGIYLPILKKLEMEVLKNRILRSLRNTNIISAESEYTLNLVKEGAKSFNRDIYGSILPNGFDKEEFINIDQPSEYKDLYSITVGSYQYKRLELAFDIHQLLKDKEPRLRKFFIIGNKNDVSTKLLSNKEVIVEDIKDRKKLINLIAGAEYYISASQIENSSIAALEGLLLAKNTVISDIPSHYEMLSNIEFSKIIEPKSTAKFLMTEGNDPDRLSSFYTWDQATQKLNEILGKYSLS